MTARPVVEVATVVSAPPSAVWRTLTARQSSMYPNTEVDTDWQVGHKVTFNGEWKGKKFTDRGEVLTSKDEEELSYTHWSDKDGSGERPDTYNVVRVKLEPEGDDQTRVILSQLSDGAEKIFDEKTKAEFRQNWQMMLDGLKKDAEKGN